MIKAILVMTGGGLGALSRYGMTLLAVKLFGTRFPWGTVAVNLLGCFLIGLAFSLAERGFHVVNPCMRLFFVTGFLGGLTTFSTFGLETANALRAQDYVIALLYFLSNNAIGTALVFVGMWVGRWSGE